MASTSTATTTTSTPPPPRPPIRYPLPIPAPPTSFPPLLRHHDAVLNSDYKSAFAGASDVVARLLPWHVWQIPDDVVALARHRADIKGKGKESEADAVARPQGKRRRLDASVARIQKAGRSDEAAFDAIQGLSFPADDELEGIMARYSALRQRHVQLRHRSLGGEPTTITEENEMVPSLPATPFSKEGHLQMLGLAYHQDRSDLEAAVNELNETRQKLIETYGPQWQQHLDSIAPLYEMPAPPPLYPRHPTRAAGPSSGQTTAPTPAPAPAPSAPTTSAASPAPTKRQTSPSASRKPKAKQAAAATAAATNSPAGQPPPPRPRPSTSAQQPPALGAASPGPAHAGHASSSSSPSNFPRPRPAYGAAPGGSASTPASAAAAAAAAAEVAATKARSASPAAPPQVAAGAATPAPTPPLRIILPLNFISKLTSAGIAPVPAKHLQPAIDAHRRQSSGAGGSAPASYSTAPCEPDPKQREAVVLLGITEGPANGSAMQRHQLVHLSVLLSRLTPPQLNALAEAVNLVQQQSAPAQPGGQQGGGGGSVSGGGQQ